MTLSLFIDTTLSGASVGLLSRVREVEKVWTGFHAQRGDADSAICRMVDEGLEQLAMKIHDIDSVIVSHGPGSFTGIKVGLAWSYGFQAARKENLLYGMSSLAEGNSEIQKLQGNSKIALLLPISRREAFLCWKGDESEYHFTSIVLFSPLAESELQSLISNAYGFYLISAEQKTTEWMRKLAPSHVFEIEMLEFMKLSLQGMMAKARTLDLETLKQRLVLPQYLKRTTVEEKFLGNQNV